MSLMYHITLVRLKADLSGPDPTSEKLELGSFSAREMFKLAAKLQKVPSAPGPNQPAIIVRHNQKGWRIVTHESSLHVHHGTSTFDDFWTVRDATGLASLPPFAEAVAEEDAENSSTAMGWLGSGLKVAGLLVLGISLMAVSLWFGMPHRKVRALPAEMVVLNTDEEKGKVFSAAAGTYVSGLRLGDAAVTISPQGEVSYGTIGKDGKIVRPPRIEEIARAGRLQNDTCVITSFGIFSLKDAESLTIGTARWRKAQIN